MTAFGICSQRYPTVHQYCNDATPGLAHRLRPDVSPIGLDTTLLQALRQPPVATSADGSHLRSDVRAREVLSECSIDEVGWEAVGEYVADVL